MTHNLCELSIKSMNHTENSHLSSSLQAAEVTLPGKCDRTRNFELVTKFRIEMNLKKWIVQNHTTYDVNLNLSEPHRVSIKSTAKMIISKFEIGFQNFSKQCILTCGF